MKSLMAALKITWAHVLAGITLAALSSIGAYELRLNLAPNSMALLFGIKVGIVSVVTTAILFFYKLFWDDTEKLKVKDYPKLIEYYRDSFVSLFLTDIMIFISAGTDAYIVFIKNSAIIQYVSHGCFFSALLFLFIFVLFFYCKVFSELHTLREIGKSAKTTEGTEQKKSEEKRSLDT